MSRVRISRALWASVVLVVASSLQANDCAPRFIRGDVNLDGRVDITDAFATLNHLFLGFAPPSCLDAADTNDDGELSLADPVYSLSHLFTGGEGLPAPNECGVDPTTPRLGCESFATCPIPAADEVCDGLDNDCDGEVDEDFDLTSADRCGACDNDCTQLDWENVVAYKCSDGVCRIEACEDGFYNLDGIDDNGCESVRPPEGTPCDDGNPCTEEDRFFLGVCGGRPKDCSELDDPCNRSDCDPATGECYRIPRPSRPCDDGDPRTRNDRCDETGECIGNAV